MQPPTQATASRPGPRKRLADYGGDLERLLVSISAVVETARVVGDSLADEIGALDRLELNAHRLLSMLSGIRNATQALEAPTLADVGAEGDGSGPSGLKLMSAMDELLESTKRAGTPSATPPGDGGSAEPEEPPRTIGIVPGSTWQPPPEAAAHKAKPPNEPADDRPVHKDHTTTPLDDLMVNLAADRRKFGEQKLRPPPQLLEAMGREAPAANIDQRRVQRARLAAAAVTTGRAPGHERPGERPGERPIVDRLAIELQQEIAGMTDSLVMLGSDASMPMSGVLEFVGNYRKTGLLRIKTVGETLQFEIIDGAVVWCASDSPPPEELLGAVLIQKGAVDRARLVAFLEDRTDTTGRIGEALENAEIVNRAQLKVALEFQVMRRFYRAFTATYAVYAFFERGEDPPDGRLRMDMAGLLFESARVQDERKRDAGPGQPKRPPA